MKCLFFVFFLCATLLIRAQTISFQKEDDSKKVRKNELIVIKADSAYIVSSSRAKYLNEKLDELKNLKLSYADLAHNHSNTIQKIIEIEGLVSKLERKFQVDNGFINQNMNGLLIDLDKTLAELKASNSNFIRNNENLLIETERLDQIIKDLKRQNRWIWWNGLTDKLVVLAGGIGVGILLANL